ncbi:MAG: DUF6503 family protein [Flavobacteriaceae bacterium]
MRFITILCVIFAFIACKDVKKEALKEMPKPIVEEKAVVREFPEVVAKIFNAHGGLDAFASKRLLSFEMPEKDITEIQTIDLRTRNEKILIGDIAMGYDGNEYWLVDEKGAYKGDPIFYHNLMFYFYTMPFVFADKGIIFGDTEALEFEGKRYPGVRITYEAGVGISSKDEYYLHYNPESFQMEWLGYTVTYRSGEKSDNVKWIRYHDWMKVSDVLLPKSISWFDYDGRVLKAPKKTVNFQNVALSETPMPDSFYSVPEGAIVVERQ